MARVRGARDISRMFSDFGEKGRVMAISIVSSLANEIRNDAVKSAPTNYGQLRQSITVVVYDSGLLQAVEVGVSYGAFVEFGTGIYVQVPAELKQVAESFKGSGRKGGASGDFEGSDFFKAILDWVRKKGIAYGATFSVRTRRRTGNRSVNDDADRKAAYVIAMSILKKGIRPQPYLYPAYVKHKKELEKRLRAGLVKLAKEAS